MSRNHREPEVRLSARVPQHVNSLILLIAEERSKADAAIDWTKTMVIRDLVEKEATRLGISTPAPAPTGKRKKRSIGAT